MEVVKKTANLLHINKNKSKENDSATGGDEVSLTKEQQLRRTRSTRSNAIALPNEDYSDTFKGPLKFKEQEVSTDYSELGYYLQLLDEESRARRGARFVFDPSTEDLFENDERDIAFIKESLERADNLTNQVIDILDSFEARLGVLETNIFPIHKLLQKWKQVHENIDQTMNSIGKVLDIFDTPTKVEERIMDGTRGDYPAYLACLDQISDAIQYLLTHKNYKSADKALEALKKLRLAGIAELENVFRSLLVKHSALIDPTRLPETMPEENKFLEILPANAVTEISKIIQRFNNLAHTAYLKEYKDKRSKFLVGSLKKFQMEKGNLGLKDSPAVNSTNLNNNNNTSEANNRQSISLQKYNDNNTQTSGQGYQKGSHRFIAFLRCALSLLTAERDLAEELLDSTSFETVFSEVGGPFVEYIGELTDSILKSRRGGESVFVNFVLFDIWDHFIKVVPLFQAALRTRGGTLDDDLMEIVNRIRAVCQKSFSDFEEDIKKDSLKQMPVDGTVYELTSTSVNYLKRLIEYRDTVESLLPQPAPGTPRNSSVIEYMLKILALLRANLEKKADKEKKTALSTIFLVNNFHYIYKTIKSGELSPVVSDNSPALGESERALDEQRSIYAQFWNKAHDSMSLLVGDDGKKPFAPTKAWSSKEKSTIKEKLKVFNSELEEQYNVQKGFTVPDLELQQRLREDVKNCLVLPYVRFTERYADAPFSKSKNKYIKYTKETLVSMLDRFFEGQGNDPKKLKFKFNS